MEEELMCGAANQINKDKNPRDATTPEEEMLCGMVGGILPVG
jgi:hypothetical protein